jgi:threonine dehydrogenase-like Zn-dependent dehydrogenase
VKCCVLPDIVEERGQTAIDRIKEMTKGVGADSVLECVGTNESMMQAIGSTRPGAYMSFVGVPHGVELDLGHFFYTHVHLHGGPAPVRRYLPQLIELVCDLKINPGFDALLQMKSKVPELIVSDLNMPQMSGL